MSDFESAYFKRQIQLWGKKTQEGLKNKKILIIGSGGLGSSLGLSLGSSGIGEIHVVDFDKVDISNIHRQILFKLCDEGKFKAEVFKSVVESRFNGVKVFSHILNFKEFIKKNNVKFDLILDATDNLETRVLIDKFAKDIEIPWIYTSVQEFFIQICFMDKARFNAFDKKGIKPTGIACPIVMMAAGLEANLAIRYLAGLEVKKDLFYYIDISSGEIKINKFKI